MVRATLTFRRPGLRPPVFVAGTFTDPAWVPREMDWVLDDRGENRFTLDIEVEKGRAYQYKFKIGHDNEWELDWQSPTTLDSMGNTNNLLTVVSTSRLEFPEQDAFPGPAQRSPEAAPSTPVRPIPLGKTLAGCDKIYGPRPELYTPPDSTGLPPTPLLSRENLVACAFDVVNGGHDNSMSPSARRGPLAPHDISTHLDDPALEEFPRDRSAVMGTTRKISTGIGEGPLQPEDRPFTSKPASRETSPISHVRDNNVHTAPGGMGPHHSQASSVALSPPATTPKKYFPEHGRESEGQPPWQAEEHPTAEGHWRRSPSGVGSYLVEKLSWLSPKRSSEGLGVLQLFWAWVYLLWSWVLGKRVAGHARRSSKIISEV